MRIAGSDRCLANRTSIRQDPTISICCYAWLNVILRHRNSPAVSVRARQRRHRAGRAGDCAAVSRSSRLAPSRTPDTPLRPRGDRGLLLAPLPRTLGDDRAANRRQRGRREVPPQPAQVAGQVVRLPPRTRGILPAITTPTGGSFIAITLATVRAWRF